MSNHPNPTILTGSGWVDLSRVQSIGPLRSDGIYHLTMVSGVNMWVVHTETPYQQTVDAWRLIRRRAVWGE